MIYKKYIAIILLVLVTACSGKEGQCLGPDCGASSDTNIANEVDQALLEAGIISRIVEEIREKVLGSSGDFSSAQGVFEGIVGNPYYSQAIAAMFSLALIFYGVGVASGILQITLGDAIIKVLKISIIAFIAGNWDTFYSTIAIFFISATDEMMIYFMQAFSPLYELQPGQTKVTDPGLIFADLDKFIALIFSQHMSAIVSALFSPLGTSSPYTLVYALILAMSLFYLFSATLKVVTIYVLALFAKALLFALAPIFLAFMLFKQTDEMFQKWWQQRVNYTLMPVLVMAFLGMFIAMVIPLITDVLQLSVRWEMSSNSLGENRWVFIYKDGSVVPTGTTSKPPVSLDTLLLLFFFAWLMESYVGIAEKIGKAVTTTISADLGNAASWMNANSQGLMGSGPGAAIGKNVFKSR